MLTFTIFHTFFLEFLLMTLSMYLFVGIIGSFPFLLLVKFSWHIGTFHVFFSIPFVSFYLKELNSILNYYQLGLSRLTFICWKSTIATLEEGRQWRCSGIFIVNFEHISYLFLEFLSLTLDNKSNKSGEMPSLKL